MISLVRAGVVAALLAVACLAANAAEKAFRNSELADSAVKLEGQIKSDAGTPTKPLAQIRRDADAAFSKNDFRAGMALLGQIVAAAPNDSATWLRLARTVMQIRPADDDEKRLLLERASTAAYIAYQRTSSRSEEADSLAFLGNVLAQRELWRPSLDALRLSLELREAADVRGQYERLREAARLPRARLQCRCRHRLAARLLPVLRRSCRARTDFSPFVALAGTDKPALVGRREAALRRRLAARRAATTSPCAPDCLRPCMRRCRSRRTFPSMCATASRGRTLLQQRLRAAAHRPARDSGYHRQHAAPSRSRFYRLTDRNLVDSDSVSDDYAPRFSSAASAATTSSSCAARAASQCGRASLRSKPPPHQHRRRHRVSRSTRRSASSSPASTSWWRSRRR